MFANHKAIEILVNGDRKATDDEKNGVLRLLRGRGQKTTNDRPLALERAVVSYDEAAKILGFKSKQAVYSAVRRGILRGCSCGDKSARSYGVTVSSIRRVLGD